jgi:diguanylate cyclase (GGDEF)-like protein
MQVYRSLSKVFPRSFTAKVFFLAFCGTHVPLIALVAYVLWTSTDLAEHLSVVLVILAATLVGTSATWFALKAILRPIYKIEAAMRAFEEDEWIEPLPQDMQDELGLLMQRTSRLMQRVRTRIRDTEQSADTDPLTGLLNRRGFDRRVASLGTGAVIALDLDRFKEINDAYGHELGDEVLKHVARVLGSNLRRQDVIARFGGEEFVAFLPGVSRNEALVAAERLRGAIEQTISVEDRRVTISVGVSLGSKCLTTLISHADKATYESKRLGRNRVSVLIPTTA